MFNRFISSSSCLLCSFSSRVTFTWSHIVAILFQVSRDDSSACWRAKLITYLWSRAPRGMGWDDFQKILVPFHPIPWNYIPVKILFWKTIFTQLLILLILSDVFIFPCCISELYYNQDHNTFHDSYKKIYSIISWHFIRNTYQLYGNKHTKELRSRYKSLSNFHIFHRLYKKNIINLIRI
jgi:hypothetical protein